MNSTKRLVFLLLAIAGAALAAFAVAQQAGGIPGAPSATAPISGKQLPPPDPKFGGVIRNDALQSKPWWPARVVPPKGAPNTAGDAGTCR